jgi:two-component system chemotaxis response regulator CheB
MRLFFPRDPVSGPAPDVIRVLVVDDSAVVRGILGRAVDAEPDMRVVTTATNGRDALDALRQQQVDIVLLDLEMPVMDGMTALPLIVEQHPSVKVIVTTSRTAASATTTMRALARGAVDFVHKPSTRTGGVGGVEAAAAEIVARVRAIARGARRTAGGDAHQGSATLAPASQDRDAGFTDDAGGVPPQVLVIAASTGGPNALASVISSLPGDFPLPVLVTQHMPPVFTTMFAQRLAREGSLPCEEARDGEVLQGGRVYVAPGDRHLVVRPAGALRAPTIRVTDDPPENHCRPAADPMFRSVAEVFGAGVLAVVLTGMGDDGRQGCESIVEAGGRVVVQDQATSVVWGMPGSVVAAGIPCRVLPLQAIGAHVTALCGARA